MALNHRDNNLRTARNLGVLRNQRALRGLVGSDDRLDFLKFRVQGHSRLTVDLNPFNGNADLWLLNRQGKVIQRSRRSGTQTEKLKTRLREGLYYLQVFTQSALDRITYRLELQSRRINTPPQLVTNTLFTSIGGATTQIGPQILKAIDAEQTAEQLTYTVTHLPSEGVLRLNGRILAIGETLTQDDIDRGRLSYQSLPQRIQLTRNEQNDDEFVAIDGSTVFWSQIVNGERELFVYDTSIRQLSLAGVNHFFVRDRGTESPVNDFRHTNPQGESIFNTSSAMFSSVLDQVGTEFYLYRRDIDATPIQITSNDTDSVIPIGQSQGNGFWQKTTGGKRQLWVYNSTLGANPTQLAGDLALRAANSAASVYIDGGNAIWIDQDLITRERLGLFFYNGSTGSITALSTSDRVEIPVRLTQSESGSGARGIDGSSVVWVESNGGDDELFLYRGSGVPIQMTDNDVADQFQEMSGNNVVFKREVDSRDELFFYNDRTGQTLQLTNTTTQNEQVLAVEQEFVVWQGSDGTDPELFLYDGTRNTTIALTGSVTNLDTETFRGLANDTVFWESNGNLWAYRLASGRQLLTDTRSVQYLHGDQVIWSRQEGTDTELVQYDGSTGQITQITHNSIDDTFVAASGANVIFSRLDGATPELFWYQGSTQRTIQLTVNSNPTSPNRFEVIDGSNMVWRAPEIADYDLFYSDGSFATHDRFQFRIADGAGKSRSGTFQIRIL